MPQCYNWRYIIFLLTRLIRGVTSLAVVLVRVSDISTHTPHTRRDELYNIVYIEFFISTHTPHTRRDGGYIEKEENLSHFYSHASYEA